MSKRRISKPAIALMVGLLLILLGGVVASIGTDVATMIGVGILLIGFAVFLVVGFFWFSIF